MTSRDGEWLVGLLLGLAAGTALGLAPSESAPTAQSFEANLRELLDSHGVALASAHMVDVGGTPSWTLTMGLPPNGRLVTIRAKLAPGQNPYSNESAEEVAGRAVAYLQKNKRLVLTSRQLAS
jgi:hypothetical protein